MTGDEKPCTREQLDAFVADFEKTELIIHGGERRRARRDVADSAFRSLVATARAGLEEGERLDQIEWFGCMTGDCPHETQAECDVAILGVVRSVMAERDAAQAGVLNGVSALPRSARSGLRAPSEEK